MADISLDRIKELVVADLVLQGFSETYAKLDFEEWFYQLKQEWIAKGKEAGWDACAHNAADFIEGGTPNTYNFKHPCDPPGVRWDTSERQDEAILIAEFLRTGVVEANFYRQKRLNEQR